MIRSAAFAWVLAACGGTSAPVVASTPVRVVEVPLSSNPPVDAGVANDAKSASGIVSAPAAVLPPAAPTTIPLAAQSSTDPMDAELLRGDAAFENGDNGEAQTHYAAAAKLGPNRAGPIVGLARVRIAAVGAPSDYAAAKGNREISRAAKDLARAVTIEPGSGAAHVELGRAYLLLGDAARAIDSLKKGVDLLPQNAEAHSTLGVALLATGKGDDALVEIARAAELDPGSAPRHGNLGTALLMRGRVSDAVREYETEVRLADGDARAHSDLGTALLAHNEVERATRELERAIQIDPTRATFRSNLGYADQMLGKMSEAIAQYREAIRIDPTLASAWINLATVLAREPHTRAEARSALEKARALDPSDPRVKANLDELDALERGAAPHP